MEDNKIMNIDNENNKEKEPLFINNLNQKEIISLINKQKDDFFDNINLEILKSINNEVFKSLSKECISDLSLQNLEILTKSSKIQFFPDFFLNKIKVSKLKDISNNFYEQIQETHIKKANEEVLKSLVKFDKFNYLNNITFEYFFKKIKFSELKEKDIFSILKELNKRKHLDYITGENFICLKNYIDKKEMEPYLYKLKTLHYIENNENKNLVFNKKSILDKNDIINEEKIVVKYEDIQSSIENFISNENYELLKTYCIKCSRNVNNNEKMLNSLNLQLKYSKNNIYDLIDELEIRKILLILSNDRENIKKQYIRIKQIIKEMQNLEIEAPDEFLCKINKYSEIIKDNSFNINFLEIIAEENYRYIKYVINKFYNGSDKNAVPTELRKILIEVINDYMNVIEKKYLIDRKKIFRGLQNIEGDNQKEQLLLFENSLNIYEKLYYDLLIQTIIEQPDSESWIESCATPVFKFLRNLALTIVGIKISSLTGSTILTTLTASIGATLILKDVKEEVIKTYFALSEENRRIYHLNQKNKPKKRVYILANKFKLKYKQFIEPFKYYSSKFFDQKILNLKEAPKIGFEKIIKYKENVEIECENYRNNEISNYYKKLKKITKMKYKQILLRLKKKFKKNKRDKQTNEIKQFFKVKESIISKIIEIKIKKLKEEYPDYKDPTFFDKTVKVLTKIKSTGTGLLKSLTNVITFGLTSKYFNKKNDIEYILQMAKNLQFIEIQEKKKKIEKEKEKSKFLILNDDIEFLSKASSNKDYELFKKMKENMKNELIEIKEEKIHFLPNFLDSNNLKENSKNQNIKDYNLNGLIEDDNISSNRDLSRSLLDIDGSDYNDDITNINI